MKTGASTSCLFPMLTERSMQHLLKLGVKNIEVFLASPSERERSYARMLKEMADAEGAKIVSVHPYSSEMEGVGFFGIYPRRFGDEADEYSRYFEACREMGADIFVFHGARSFVKLENKFYFERFERLREVAKRFGVRLCQENVARCHSGRTEFLTAMKSAIPDVEFVLDVKQAVRAGISPFDMLDVMGKSMAHLHLSDHNSGCDCLVPGEGDFELERFAHKLKTTGYGGNIILELYSWFFNGDEALAKGIKLFDEFLK